jgi:hypothetical protein
VGLSGLLGKEFFPPYSAGERLNACTWYLRTAFRAELTQNKTVSLSVIMRGSAGGARHGPRFALTYPGHKTSWTQKRY